ncbi:acyl-CoA dehydrogenase [Paeniglutamicibacter gangotriensis]|uniref:Acyl-CoA dehydrogenase n=1 Tax=Paeniglutamicibacter gangotriensis TaxID=254787 RepID=A0A5B0EAK4_9MICC|nr:acyl-CoA dehydrogenase family protein [Paeniglutamicibacter gangotriensis]KAA0976057.1 acyl-CoA dehydrogenase [Paeniglutamicibacter gangotriensis]
MAETILIAEATSAGADTAALAGIFEPLFARIAAGAIERELDRRLPFEEIRGLLAAGFGRLRVPREHGGFGASHQQFFSLLADLGAADSNIVQALRGHIGFVEFTRTHPNEEFRRSWFARIAAGALVGNAESERTGVFSEQSTQVAERDGQLLLNGTKYYSTGSIFADWILVGAAHREGDQNIAVTVLVATSHPRVDTVDDWDGFGQRLTGSGTTVFTDVPVDPGSLTPRDAASPHGSVLHATYQLVHLAALAGIATAALREVTEFVRGRSRNLFNPAVPARRDPVALQVLGECFGTVASVRSTVLGAAASIDAASAALDEGIEAHDLLAAADAHVFGVQGTVIDAVLGCTGRLFEVGGASATASGRALDRHWRNARTVSSHNPATYRQQAVGDYLVNGTAPGELFERLLAAVPAAEYQSHPVASEA